MPAIEFSSPALISAISSRVRVKASLISRRMMTENQIINGRNAKIISVSRTLMVQSMINEPISMITDRKRSSGPWWANSEMSIRSLMIRDMMEPVLCSSKKEKGSLWSRRKMSRRISAWIRTPTIWP